MGVTIVRVDNVTHKTQDGQTSKITVKKGEQSCSFTLSGVKSWSVETGRSWIEFETVDEVPLRLEVNALVAV